MQKITLIYENNGGDVNKLLKEGWRVVSIYPATHNNKIAAYVLLEKDDGEGDYE